MYYFWLGSVASCTLVLIFINKNWAYTMYYFWLGSVASGTLVLIFMVRVTLLLVVVENMTFPSIIISAGSSTVLALVGVAIPSVVVGCVVVPVLVGASVSSLASSRHFRISLLKCYNQAV